MDYTTIFNCTVEIFILPDSSSCLRTSNFEFPGFESHKQDLGCYHKITFLNDNQCDIEKSLNDVPIGLKLLNAYCCKQEKHTLTVGTLDDTDDHEKFERQISTLTNGYLPGSWNFAKQSILKEKGNDVEELSEATERMSISSDSANANATVKIDSESLYYHVVPRRKDDVYAIVSTVTISKKEEKVHVQCSYVSILPHAKYWLKNALSCLSDTIKTQEELLSSPREDGETNESIVSEIRDIINSKSRSIASGFLRSPDDSLRKTLVKLHNRLTKEDITDVGNTSNNSEKKINATYYQIYVVSNLDLSTDSNRKKARKKLIEEFKAYGGISSIDLYATFQIAVVRMHLSTDDKGNFLKHNEEGTKIVTGSPMDLYGLYINDKSIIVKMLPLNPSSLCKDFSDYQTSLTIKSMPFSKNKDVLKQELKDLFSTFGFVWKVVTPNCRIAYVYFSNNATMKTVGMGLSMNGIYVGNKLLEIEQNPIPTCQICGFKGHIEKYCRLNNNNNT